MSTLDPAGSGAREAYYLWWGMAVFFGAVLVAVVALWIHALRRPPADDAATATSHSDSPRTQQQQNLWIIGGGIVLPLLSIMAVLAFGIPAGKRMAGAGIDPDSMLEIHVTAHQWWWLVRYADTGLTLINELHIPAGTPVKLTLTSADVIHSFWVPRIGQKLDAIPGHVNQLFLQADEAGIYPGVCAEFCGLSHAHMTFELHAHAPADFSAWQQTQQSAGGRE